MEKTEQPKYNSNYEAEITYTSDKNFVVRLKAMIDRTMSGLGYNNHDEKFLTLIESLESAEDYLFASRTTTPSSSPVEAAKEIIDWDSNDWMKFVCWYSGMNEKSVEGGIKQYKFHLEDSQ